MSINFRATTAQDSHYLIDIDLKCFDTALTPEEWREINASCLGAVATWYGTPIGMIVTRRTEENDVEVVRLAVKKPYRRLGIGRRLLQNAVAHAREVASTRCFVIVPETSLAPGEPDELSVFLSKCGFRAEKPLLRDHFHSCGTTEDGVVFARAVPLS